MSLLPYRHAPLTTDMALTTPFSPCRHASHTTQTRPRTTLTYFSHHTGMPLSPHRHAPLTTQACPSHHTNTLLSPHRHPSLTTQTCPLTTLTHFSHHTGKPLSPHRHAPHHTDTPFSSHTDLSNLFGKLISLWEHKRQGGPLV